MVHRVNPGWPVVERHPTPSREVLLFTRAPPVGGAVKLKNDVTRDRTRRYIGEDHRCGDP
jgi:hypothetical protein